MSHTDWDVSAKLPPGNVKLGLKWTFLTLGSRWIRWGCSRAELGVLQGIEWGWHRMGRTWGGFSALAHSLFCEAKSVSCCPPLRVMSKACSVSPLNLKLWFEVPRLYIQLWRSAFHKGRTVSLSYWLCPLKTGAFIFPIKDVDLLNGGWTPAEFYLIYTNIKKGGTMFITAEPFFF